MEELTSADSEYVRNLGLIVGNDATRDLQINWEDIEVLAGDPIPVRSLSLTTFRENCSSRRYFARGSI